MRRSCWAISKWSASAPSPAEGLHLKFSSSLDELVRIEVGHEALEGIDEGDLVGAAPHLTLTAWICWRVRWRKIDQMNDST